MKQLSITILLAVLLPNMMMGQCYSSQKKPDWVSKGYYKELKNSRIATVTATGATEEEARNKAMQMIVENQDRSTGQNLQRQNGNFVSSSKSIELKAIELEKYTEKCENGEYRVSLLVQTGKEYDSKLEQVEITDEYPITARVLIPGMAQLQKGSTSKGIMFIAGEALLIGGVVFAENRRANEMSLFNTTRDKATHRDNAQMYETTRNILIAGAGALYVWNVIDGCIARGAQKTVRVAGFADVQFEPFIIPTMGSGLKLTLNF